MLRMLIHAIQTFIAPKEHPRVQRLSYFMKANALMLRTLIHAF
jgi:hypothetical protein